MPLNRLTAAFLVAALPALGVALAPAAWAQDDHDHDDHDEDHHVAEAAGVRVVHAWTRATHDGAALIFMSIENCSDREVSLVGGDSEDAEGVTLVGFQLRDGEPAYVALPGVPVAPGRELVLAPNGLAVQASGLAHHLDEGGEWEIEVEFDGFHIETHVEIGAADATRHSHAGHRHE